MWHSKGEVLRWTIMTRWHAWNRRKALDLEDFAREISALELHRQSEQLINQVVYLLAERPIWAINHTLEIQR